MTTNDGVIQCGLGDGVGVVGNVATLHLTTADGEERSDAQQADGHDPHRDQYLGK